MMSMGYGRRVLGTDSKPSRGLRKNNRNYLLKKAEGPSTVRYSRAKLKAGIRTADVKEQYPQVSDNTRKYIPEPEDPEREPSPMYPIRTRTRINIQTAAKQSHHQKRTSSTSDVFKGPGIRETSPLLHSKVILKLFQRPKH